MADERSGKTGTPGIGESLQYRAMVALLIAYRDSERYAKRKITLDGRAPLLGLEDQIQRVGSAMFAFGSAYNEAIRESREELAEKSLDMRALVDGTAELTDSSSDSRLDKADAISEGFEQAMAINGFGDDDDEETAPSAPKFRQLVSNESMMGYREYNAAMKVLFGIDMSDENVEAADSLRASRAEYTAEDLDKVVRAMSSFSDSFGDIPEIISPDVAMTLRRDISDIQARIYQASSKSRNPYIGIRTAVESFIGPESLEGLDNEPMLLSSDKLSLQDPMRVGYLVNDMENDPSGILSIASTLIPRNGKGMNSRFTEERAVKALQLLAVSISGLREDPELDRNLSDVRKSLDAIGYREGVDGLEPIPVKDNIPSAGELIANNQLQQAHVKDFAEAEGRENAIWNIIVPAALGIMSPTKYIAEKTRLIDRAIDKGLKKKKENPDAVLKDPNEDPKSTELRVASYRDIDKKIGDDTYYEKLGLKEIPSGKGAMAYEAVTLFRQRSISLASLRVIMSLYDDRRPADFSSLEKDRDTLVSRTISETAKSVAEWGLMKRKETEAYKGLGEFFGIDTAKAAAEVKKASHNAMTRVSRLPGRGYLSLIDGADGLKLRDHLMREDGRLIGVIEERGKTDPEILASAIFNTALFTESVDRTGEIETLRAEKERLIDSFIAMHAKELEAFNSRYGRTEGDYSYLLSKEDRSLVSAMAENAKDKDALSLFASFNEEVAKPLGKAIGEEAVSLSRRISKKAGLSPELSLNASRAFLNDPRFFGTPELPWLSYAGWTKGTPDPSITRPFTDTIRAISETSRMLDEKTEALKRADDGDKEKLSAELDRLRASVEMQSSRVIGRIAELISEDWNALSENLYALAEDASNTVSKEAERIYSSSIAPVISGIEEEARKGYGRINAYLKEHDGGDILETVVLADGSINTSLSIMGAGIDVLKPVLDEIERNPSDLALPRDEFIAKVPYSELLSKEEAGAVYDKAQEELQKAFPDMSISSALGLSGFPKAAAKAGRTAVIDSIGSGISPESVLSRYTRSHDHRFVSEEDRERYEEIKLFVSRLEEKRNESEKELLDIVSSIDRSDVAESSLRAYRENAAFIADHAFEYAEVYSKKDISTPEGFLDEFREELETGDKALSRDEAVAEFLSFGDDGEKRYTDAFMDAVKTASSERKAAWNALLESFSEEDARRMLRKGVLDSLKSFGYEERIEGSATAFTEPFEKEAEKAKEAYGEEARKIVDDFFSETGMKDTLGFKALERTFYSTFDKNDLRAELEDTFVDTYSNMQRAYSRGYDDAENAWQKTIAISTAERRLGKEAAASMASAAEAGLSFTEWLDSAVPGYSRFDELLAEYKRTASQEILRTRNEIAENIVSSLSSPVMENKKAITAIVRDTLDDMPVTASRRADAYKAMVADSFSSVQEVFNREKEKWVDAHALDRVENIRSDRTSRLTLYWKALEEKAGKAEDKRAAMKEARDSFIAYEKRELSTAVSLGAIPAPYDDIRMRFAEFSELAPVWKEAINEECRVGADFIRDSVSVSVEAALDAYKEAGLPEMTAEEEKGFRELFVSSYHQLAAEAKLSGVYKDVTEKENAHLSAMRERIKLPEEMNREKILAMNFSKGVAPVIRTSSFVNALQSSLSESRFRDLQDIGRYIKAYSRMPESAEKKAIISSAEKAFEGVINDEVRELHTVIENAKRDTDRFRNIPDPSRLYSSDKQYTAAEGIYMEYRALMRSEENRKSPEELQSDLRAELESAEKDLQGLEGKTTFGAMKRAEDLRETVERRKSDLEIIEKEGADSYYEKTLQPIRDNIERYFQDIRMNNPGENDIDLYSDAILSGKKKDMDKAMRGIYRLAIMGSPVPDGSRMGVKGFVNTLDSFPTRSMASALSAEYSDSMKAAMPSRRELQDKRRIIENASMNIRRLTAPGAKEAAYSMIALSGENLMRVMPPITLMRPDGEREAIDENAMETLRKAVRLEDENRAALIEKADTIWKDARALQSLRTSRNSVIPELINEYGAKNGIQRPYMTLAANLERSVADFTRVAENDKRELLRAEEDKDIESGKRKSEEKRLSDSRFIPVTPEDEIRTFCIHDEYWNNPAFSAIREGIIHSSGMSEKDFNHLKPDMDAIRSYVSELRYSGSALERRQKVSVSRDGNASSLSFNADGSVDLETVPSVRKAMMNAIGVSGSVVNRGHGPLLLDKSLSAENERNFRMSITPVAGIDRAGSRRRTVSPILNLDSYNVERRDTARNRAMKDTLLSELVPDNRDGNALTPRASEFVLDLHSVPGLTADKMMEEVHQRLLSSGKSYVADFFRKGNYSVIHENHGIAIISFKGVEKTRKNDGSKYMADLTATKVAKAQIPDVQRVVESVLRNEGFRTADGSAVFHVRTGDAGTIIKERISEAENRERLMAEARAKTRYKAMTEKTEERPRIQTIQASGRSGRD